MCPDLRRSNRLKRTEGQGLKEFQATEQYPVVLLTFESVDEILKCDHSNESWSEAVFNRPSL